MKFDITLDNGHSAQVVADLGASHFTGSIASLDFGSGEITNGRRDEGRLTGNVSLGGHVADFEAALDGSKISGSIRYGWFFSMNFTGSLVS